MSTTLIATYIATCVLLAVTPGPNMALIIANTLGGGLRAGLVTLTGTLTGLTILVVVATVGMTSIMILMAEWFEIIRWCGAVYLIVLGILQLRAFWRSRSSTAAEHAPRKVPSAASRYTQGLLVALSNPKVLLFLGAFFPQFVRPDAALPLLQQLTILAVLFVATLAIVDLAYTLAIAHARRAFDIKRLRVLDGIAGGLLIAGGLVLATTKRI